MNALGTLRLLVFLTPLCVSVAQVRPSDRTKAHDRNWLKSELQRRYGTTALSNKTTAPKSTTPSPSNDKQPPKKEDGK